MTRIAFLVLLALRILKKLLKGTVSLVQLTTTSLALRILKKLLKGSQIFAQRVLILADLDASTES